MAHSLEQAHRLLGVEARASSAEIKKAFRRLAKKWHPDLWPDKAQAAARFVELKDAYERALTLARLRELKSESSPASDPAPAGRPFGPEVSWRIAGVEAEGLDVIYYLEVDQAPGQAQATLPHRHDQACPQCRGRGESRRWSWSRFGWETISCPRCHGSGLIERVKPLAVRLPARLREKTRLRVAGHGKLEARSGRRGDLFVELQPVRLAA